MLTNDNNEQKNDSKQQPYRGAAYPGPSKLGCFLLFRACWKDEVPSHPKKQQPLLQQTPVRTDDSDAHHSKGCCIS